MMHRVKGNFKLFSNLQTELKIGSAGDFFSSNGYRCMIHHVKGNFKPFSNPQTELKNNKKNSQTKILNNYH